MSTNDDDEDMLLGKHTPVVQEYSPQLLYPIARAEGRARLDLKAPLAFQGADVWHAYELSWLDAESRPVAKLGRLTVAADSEHIVESKSLKLYLNSLNFSKFESEAEFQSTIESDVSACAGAPVTLELFNIDDPAFTGGRLPGMSLDDLPCATVADSPNASALIVDQSLQVQESLFSHLLRSLCPVTGQPDWASILVQYRGGAIDHSALLAYLIAFRQHREFHEQCVERIFTDICNSCAPKSLTIQAFYTRRGGLDISPFRTNDPAAQPRARLQRQ